jgi:hypothetical protein
MAEVPAWDVMPVAHPSLALRKPASTLEWHE